MKKTQFLLCNKTGFPVFLALWNRVQGHTTPDIHLKMADWLQRCWETGKRRLLLMAFRASGKSTLAGLFSAWVLWRDPECRILVLAAESSLARRMVRNIRKTIEKHPLTKHLKPNNPDQWAGDRFTVLRARELRDPSVRAAGITSNITGSRADLIICDDVEVPNTCDTADKRTALRERLAETDFILTPGGTKLYIGTPHSWHSIYADTPCGEAGEETAFLQGYARLEIPVLDASGQSAWPERYSLEDIDALRIGSGPARFESQMMLRPVNIAEGRLDAGLLQAYDAEPDYTEAQRRTVLSLSGKRLVSCSAWWDPAFGGDKGDASVLAIVYTDEDGLYYLHRVEYLKVRVRDGEDEAALQCRRVAELARDFYVPSVAVEINGLGRFLPSILRRELAVAGVPCTVLEMSSRRPKDLRILEAFDAVMAAHALHAHRSVWRTPLIAEMREWRPDQKNAQDDGLDAVAGALSLEPVRLKRSCAAPPARNWTGAGAGHQARTDFEV